VRGIIIAGAVALVAVPGGTIPAAAATTGASAARPLATISASAYLGGSKISCGSATSCLAVGSNVGTQHTTATAEALSGTTWKAVPVKSPKGAADTALSGVSCKAATYCLAVGEHATSSGPSLPYALTWNGKTLTPIPSPPLPKGDSLYVFDTVSCVAVKSCVTVGTSISTTPTGGPGLDVFTDTWNGSKWTDVKTVVSGAVVLDEFTALHCFSAKACVAAGTAFSDTGAVTVLVARWNGKTWTREKAVTPAGKQLLVTDLSCVSASSCALAGFSSNAAATSAYGFLETWNGKTWSEARWPAATGDTVVYALGISCASSGDCIAVGTAGTSKSGAAAALSWNGRHWAALPVPGPAKGDSSDFEGVSCPKANDCVAIGAVGKSNATTVSPLAGYWNGTAWRLAAA
jgi:hypothetical protein